MDQTIIAPGRRVLRLGDYPVSGTIARAKFAAQKLEGPPPCLRRRPIVPKAWLARLNVHLAVASVPVLAISAHVFWLVSLRTVALFVLLPLVTAIAIFVRARPDRSDRVILAGFLWGLLACAGYDALRLPTVYVAHWWTDFFPAVGGWAVGGDSNVVVGYLWRYVGDGGGIAVAFFVLAATLGAGAWPLRRIMGLALAYAICPVWAGLVLTDVLAPGGRQLFSLSFTSIVLALAGHLVYGAVLGLGFWKSRRLEPLWPVRLADLPKPSAVRRVASAHARP
jgi:hypothetical protein